MVKAESKRVNMRVRSEVRFMLEELCKRWGCSQTKAMERAITEAHGSAWTATVDWAASVGGNPPMDVSARGARLPSVVTRDLEVVPIDEA